MEKTKRIEEILDRFSAGTFEGDAVPDYLFTEVTKEIAALDEWVSVESLPNENENGFSELVMIYADQGWNFCPYTVGYYDFHKKIWNCRKYSPEILNITHWQPLPNKPNK